MTKRLKEALQLKQFPKSSKYDAIISVDSYHYYGTDEMYLPYFLKF